MIPLLILGSLLRLLLLIIKKGILHHLQIARIYRNPKAGEKLFPADLGHQTDLLVDGRRIKDRQKAADNGYDYAVRRGVSPDKIAFLRNGIDKPENLKRDEQLYKELAPNNEKLLLSVSRLDDTKNVDKIIEAFHKVSGVLPDTRLVIVGDGSLRKSMEDLASGLGISHRISFVGMIYQKDVFKYQSVADIFISLNEISSLSNAVFEAMACGNCVIALDRGATRELINDGKNGIVIKSYDELSDAIIRLLSDSDMITRLGLEARTTISEQHSWEERVQKEVDMINNLCSGIPPLSPNH